MAVGILFVSSGGRLASLMRRVPIPAIMSWTGAISPVTYLYIVSPLVASKMSCTDWNSLNLIYTCLRVPSIWIVSTECSVTFSCSCIHSCMSNAVIRGLLCSKQQTNVLRRSLIVCAVVSFWIPVTVLITLHAVNTRNLRASLETLPSTVAAASELGFEPGSSSP